MLQNETIDPLKDGKSKVQLIDFMGGDLAVVNDARCSFNKISSVMGESDTKLLKYLIIHKHWSPFRSTVFKFKVKMPLFLCRQHYKHVVASTNIESQNSHNEQSARYVEMDNEFYIPDVFRCQSKSNRQATEGSLEDVQASLTYRVACENSYRAYKELLNLGVGREQARGVLVPAVYTTFVWTVSLQSLLHYIYLREGNGAQTEITLYANAFKEIATRLAPVVFEIFAETVYESSKSN